MPDSTPDNQTYLRIPGWLWEKFFHAACVVLLAYFVRGTQTAVESNGVQQVKHAEAQIAKAEEVKTAIVANTAVAAAASPRQVDVNIQQINSEAAADSHEAKAADEKPAEGPPGTSND